MPRHVFALAASLMFACAPHAVAPSTLEPVSVLPPASSNAEPPAHAAPLTASGNYLVWTGDGSLEKTGVTLTHRLSADGNGLTETGRVEGVVIAAAGRLYRFGTERVEVKTVSCESLLGPPDSAAQSGDPGFATRAFVERVDDGRQSELVAPPVADGVASFEHRVRAIGSVGPYLFLIENTFDYACGAHGGVSARFRVFDLTTGNEKDVLSTREREHFDAVERNFAAARFNDAGGDSTPKRPDEFSLAFFRPSFGANAELGLDVVFFTDVCYACSSGDWASYTATAGISAQDLPQALAPFAHPTPELSRAVAGFPAGSVHGWSKVDGTEAEARAIAKLFGS